MMIDAFTKAELRTLRRLGSPSRIQRFLDEEVAYNKEAGGHTCRSPRRVLRDMLGHCMEGALLGAAALEAQGHEPMLLDLGAVHDDDHVLAVFRQNGCWGAVAKSDNSGLRFREPVYRTLRELALSYFEHYFNLRGEKTLRTYSRPVRLKRFDRIGWRTAEADVWAIPEHLVDVHHYRILSAAGEKSLSRMDRRLFAAGRLGSVV
ncbi:MAG: hypothetical protein JJE04_20140 [Acidobacteriia bacterium]|nr:hypothetical protein [Terriglobia bacterium]